MLARRIPLAISNSFRWGGFESLGLVESFSGRFETFLHPSQCNFTSTRQLSTTATTLSLRRGNIPPLSTREPCNRSLSYSSPLSLPLRNTHGGSHLFNQFLPIETCAGKSEDAAVRLYSSERSTAVPYSEWWVRFKCFLLT